MDFSQVQNFPESNLITTDHVGKTGILSYSKMCISAERELRQISTLRTPNSDGAASLYLRGNAALKFRSTLEQFAPRKILLLRDIQGWSAPGQTPFQKTLIKNKCDSEIL
jgi:hypothetical protein